MTSSPSRFGPFGGRSLREFRTLAYKILEYAGRGTPRIGYLRQVLETILESSACDSVEVRLSERGRCYRARILREGRTFQIDSTACPTDDPHRILCRWGAVPGLERLCLAVLGGHLDAGAPGVTESGSFWTGDCQKPVGLQAGGEGSAEAESISMDGESRSLVIIPVNVTGRSIGLVLLESRQPQHFTVEGVEFYEGLVHTLGAALAYRYSQVACRERVKELTCLYGIARLAEQPDRSLPEILDGIADVLPPGWLYSQIASARVVVDGVSHTSENYRPGDQSLKADVLVMGERRGFVEVSYSKPRPDLDEGPFLREERSLIDTVAKEVALIIERKQAEEDKARTEEQLRHADRLATIGQLAAGVAHELNEPLGGILGFAQLAQKCAGLPKQAEEDISRIVSASLHAREVIRKLVLFARQVPPRKSRVDLNEVVEEGLFFFEGRCAKAGIDLVRDLTPGLPEVTADPSQLNQVLINLVVNGMQAMPGGGTLTVSTRGLEGQVSLIVEDTGVGMTDDVRRRLFVPFFTTKDVDEGTGLGLAVVHGIVSSHGGSIDMDSELGRGSRFEVHLPLGGNDEESSE